MEELLRSLEKTIEQKNWYAALIMTITLPDIAGHIDSPTDDSQKRYVKWFDEYIKQKYPTTNKVYYGIEGLVFGVTQAHTSKPFFITGEECYAIRCTILHEGSYKINGQQVLKNMKDDSLNIIDRVADCVRFTFEDNTTNAEYATIQFIGNQNILQINVSQFCIDIKDGLYKWMEDIKLQPAKQERLKQSLKIFTYSNLHRYQQLKIPRWA
jgi:hypothetical protein